MRFVSLDRWPRRPTQNRKSGYGFRAAYSETLKKLETELHLIGAYNILLQVDIPASKIRQDGSPYANAPEPYEPGVILSFDSEHGSLSYACDTYDLWKANLRAIVLTLEALRAVGRWGASTHGEQYKGYTAIPADHASDAMTTEDARSLLQRHGGYREAVLSLHPDHGGSPEEFMRVQRAKEVLQSAGVAVP